MRLNPNPGSGIQPLQLENPLNAFSKVLQIKGQMNENSFNESRMAEVQRARSQEEALNAAYAAAVDPATGQVDPNKLRMALASGGMGSKLPGVEKGLADAAKGRADAIKAQTDLIGERMKLSRQLLDNVNSPEAYIGWHEANHKDPVLGPYLAERGVTAESARARIMQALQAPGGFEQLLQESKIGSEKALERHFTSQTLGDETRLVSTPKYGMGPAVEVPGSRANVDMTSYQKGMLAKREGGTTVNNPAPVTVTDVIDPNNPGQMIKVDARTYRGGGIGSPGVIGPSGKEPIVGINLSQKDIQAREKVFPKATVAIKAASSKATEMEADLKKLADHPGLSGITGLIYGRTPAVTPAAREANALLEKIMARGGFAELAAMRDASPTGGALGNISDREGAYLRQAFGALNPTQSTESFKKALKEIAASMPGVRERLQEAFDTTYEYRASNARAPKPAANVVDTNNPLLK